jgi:hypothetical protein
VIQCGSNRNFRDVFGLRTFGPVRDLKLDFLALYQGFIAIAGDRTVVHENILFTGLLDKTVALSVIEPFDHSNRFRHRYKFLLQTSKH